LLYNNIVNKRTTQSQTAERTNTMEKTAVIKKLVKAGFGLPKAIKIYNELSSNGFYEVSNKELAEYIKKNGI